MISSSVSNVYRLCRYVGVAHRDDLNDDLGSCCCVTSDSLTLRGCKRCVQFASLFVIGLVADLIIMEICVTGLKMQASVLRAVRQLPRIRVSQTLLDMCFMLPTRQEVGRLYIPCGAYMGEAFFKEAHNALSEVCHWLRAS